MSVLIDRFVCFRHGHNFRLVKKTAAAEGFWGHYVSGCNRCGKTIAGVYVQAEPRLEAVSPDRERGN